VKPTVRALYETASSRQGVLTSTASRRKAFGIILAPIVCQTERLAVVLTSFGVGPQATGGGSTRAPSGTIFFDEQSKSINAYNNLWMSVLGYCL